MPVISSIILYLAVVSISCFFLKYLVGQGHTELACGSFQKSVYINSNYKIIFTCLICILPIVVIYTIRLIGYDFFAYEKSYYILHDTGIFEYFGAHRGTVHDTFYVEPGYYLLNRIAPNFQVLQFFNALVIFIPCFKAICIYRAKISPDFAFFIFYATQFFGAMETVRFGMASSLILLAFVYLLHDKNLKFFACVVIASLFHTVAWLALLYLLLKESRSKLLNQIRDTALVMATLSVPYFGEIFYALASVIPQFKRLYALYPLREYKMITFRWWIHFVPVILPILIIFGKRILETKEERTMFRIFLTEIPLRLFAYYNKWFGRLCRIPQLIQVIYIPYMLKKVKRREDQKLLLFYYIVWYVFYFLFLLFTYNVSPVYRTIFS